MTEIKGCGHHKAVPCFARAFFIVRRLKPGLIIIQQGCDPFRGMQVPTLCHIGPHSLVSDRLTTHTIMRLGFLHRTVPVTCRPEALLSQLYDRPWDPVGGLGPVEVRAVAVELCAEYSKQP